ncbi:hypothetical protein ACI797_22730 [Geodermatophilus sp. SYSU D00691]
MAVAGRPDLARALVAAAGFIPASVEYGEHTPDGRHVGGQYRWAGTADELWDTETAIVN